MMLCCAVFCPLQLSPAASLALAKEAPCRTVIKHSPLTVTQSTLSATSIVAQERLPLHPPSSAWKQAFGTWKGLLLVHKVRSGGSRFASSYCMPATREPTCWPNMHGRVAVLTPVFCCLLPVGSIHATSIQQPHVSTCLVAT